MTSIVLFRVVAVIAVLLTGVAGGLIAVRLGRSQGSARKLLSFGSAFAGGIFLGAGLLHMLPDAVGGLRDVLPNSSFPYAELLCAAGFAAVLLLERVVAGGDEAEVVAGAESAHTAYLLLAVLSVHSMLAGAALGLESTLVGSVVLLLAIVAHKGSAAFALGLSFGRAAVSQRRVVRIVLLFSCATPSGIVLGAMLDSLLEGTAGTVTEAVFDAVAAGTFLYVAVLDIIREEFAVHEGRWLKFVLLSAGLGLMSILAAFV